MPQRAWINRRLRWVLGGAVIVLLILYIALPTLMALAVVAEEHTFPGEPPDGFDTVMLTTADGVRLGAWYAPPENGAVIVLLHGAGSGRESVRPYALMLREHGFGVLAVSLRGYGDSEGQINRLGWNGTRDVGAAMAFLAEQDDVQAIGGLGLSLGGEVLLGAASSYPAISAIVTDGATYRSLAEYRSLPLNRPLYRYFTTGVFTVMVRLFSRDLPPSPPLLDSVKAAPETAFLFIAAGNDRSEIAFNTLFHDQAADHSAVWIVPDAGHTEGFSRAPDAYQQRVVAFLTNAFRS